MRRAQGHGGVILELCDDRSGSLADRDGTWDVSYWDTTGDGEMNLEGSHPDGNLMPSGYAPAS